jgi:hypothetical protein
MSQDLNEMKQNVVVQWIYILRNFVSLHIKLIIFYNNKRKKNNNNEIPWECQNNQAKRCDLSQILIYFFDTCMVIDNDKKIRYGWIILIVLTNGIFFNKINVKRRKETDINSCYTWKNNILWFIETILCLSILTNYR